MVRQAQDRQAQDRLVMVRQALVGSQVLADKQAQARVESQRTVTRSMPASLALVTLTLGRQGRAMAHQLLLRATLAAQATLALTATGTATGQARVRVRAMVDQTATGPVARDRTRATVDQTTGHLVRVRATVDLVQTGADLRQTSRMGRTPPLLEVALVLSMALGPLEATEAALRLISQLVLWVRVQTATKQPNLAYYAVK